MPSQQDVCEADCDGAGAAADVKEGEVGCEVGEEEGGAVVDGALLMGGKDGGVVTLCIAGLGGCQCGHCAGEMEEVAAGLTRVIAEE